VTISLITLLDMVVQTQVLEVVVEPETERFTLTPLMAERIASEMVVPEALEP
jgi:hypothetical protein